MALLVLQGIFGQQGFVQFGIIGGKVGCGGGVGGVAVIGFALAESFVHGHFAQIRQDGHALYLVNILVSDMESVLHDFFNVLFVVGKFCAYKGHITMAPLIDFIKGGCVAVL